MIIIKELFVNFPRFHRGLDYDDDHDYDIDKGLSAALLLFKRCL